MKKHLNFLPIIALFISSSVIGATLSKIEIYPYFVGANCKTIGVDQAGLVAISTKKVSAIDTADTVKLTQEAQLKVCELSVSADGLKSLAWRDVSPFQGYPVQYYDFETNSIQNKIQFVDSSSKANRFEAMLSVEAKGIFIKSLMNEESKSTLEIKKADLLDQNDMDKLDAGLEVKKVVMLSNILNVTIKIKDLVFQSGDMFYSGSNLSLTFIKSNNLYKIKSMN